MTDTVPAPTSATAGVTPGFARLRVVDATTGAPIANVVMADAVAGKVTRMAVEDGNFVRNGDTFEMIEEDRAVRIEWIASPLDPATAAAAGTPVETEVA